MSRVLVTGIGAVTSAGTGREALWNALCDGGAPATSSTPVAPPGLPAADPVLLAPMATPPAQEYLGRRGIRVLSPESKAFAIAAVAACRDAGLPTRWECEPTVGVAAGTTTAGLADYVELLATRLDLGVERVNPAQGPQTGLNAPAATASIFTGAGGPNLTLSTGRAASADALAASARAVHAGEATVMLAGGVQTLTYPEVYARRGVDPRFGTVDRARPLDRERAGAVPGEAAVVLALESADAAARRRAVVLAEVVGTGAAMGPATGAGSVSAARRAVDQALAAAGATPDEVDAVFVSACGDPGLDATEATVVGQLWADRVPVCAVQGRLGDCAGAAGAVQAAAAVLALHAQRLPGTAGHHEPDPALPALRLPTAPRDEALRQVLVLCTDPHGHASALLLAAPASGGPAPDPAGPRRTAAAGDPPASA